jgi:hypothetical protein
MATLVLHAEDNYGLKQDILKLPINDTEALALQAAIELADQKDAVPGDHVLELNEKIDVPFDINLFITHWKGKVSDELKFSLSIAV